MHKPFIKYRTFSCAFFHSSSKQSIFQCETVLRLRSFQFEFIPKFQCESKSNICNSSYGVTVVITTDNTKFNIPLHIVMQFTKFMLWWSFKVPKWQQSFLNSQRTKCHTYGYVTRSHRSCETNRTSDAALDTHTSAHVRGQKATSVLRSPSAGQGPK